MSRMITLQLPTDRELLAAFGEVALRHEHLSHILRMTIKTLADLRPDESGGRYRLRRVAPTP